MDSDGPVTRSPGARRHGPAHRLALRLRTSAARPTIVQAVPAHDLPREPGVARNERHCSEAALAENRPSLGQTEDAVGGLLTEIGPHGHAREAVAAGDMDAVVGREVRPEVPRERAAARPGMREL